MVKDISKILLTVLLGVSIFVLDVSIELGVSGGVPYIVFVLMGMRFRDKRVTILLGVTAVLLTVVGFYLSQKGQQEIWKTLLNRVYAVTAIIIVTVFVYSQKKILKEKAKKSEEKFKKLSNLTFEGVLIHNKGIVIDINLSFEKMFGYSREELVGKDIINHLFPKKHHKIICKSITKNYTKPFEIEGIRKNGSIFPIEIEARDFISENNEKLRVAAFRDVTERIIVTEALKQSEKKFREIFEKSSDAILIINNGIFIDCNQATVKMLNYKLKEDFINSHPSELSPELQPDGLKSNIKAEKMMALALKNGTHRFEWMHTKSDGKIFPVEVLLTVISNEPNNKTTHCVWRDITDRKKAELENKKLSTVVEQSANAIFLTNTDGRIEYVNPRFTEVSGYSAEDSIGKTPRILKSGLQTKKFYTQLWRIIKAGKIWKGEFQNKAKNGSLYWEQATISPIKNNEGEITNYLAVKEDITFQKKTEKVLKNALAKAKESDKLKSAFLANMSHEIRTPMNGIIGFSEFLLEPNLSKKGRKEYANVVIKCSKQLLNIVNDILDISKIEAGAIQLNYENVNINKLLDDLYIFYQPKAKENNLNLHYEKGLEGDNSIVNIDKTKLNQVLKNLLSNSFKFTEEGSIEFGYQLVEDKLQFYVKDTGVGIDKKIKNKIYDRFYQENLKLNKQYRGTGLGLSISKNFVELFDGNMWYNSNEKGTIMYFTIPYITKKEPIISIFTKEEHGESQVKNKDLTILVAEDEAFNRMYINELFSKTNFKIIEAHNGKQALELFNNNSRIDLVLMDIQMPEMNGIEAMKKIKEIKPSLPIIGVSAFALESDKEKALENGFDNYLTKPINRKLLFNIINKYSSQIEKEDSIAK